jgi:hypothetical protein
MQSITLDAIIRFTHAASGTFIEVMSSGEGSDTRDKASNKALTGAYKYAIRRTFCIETGDDPVTCQGILIQSLSANSSTECRQGDPPLVG